MVTVTVESENTDKGGGFSICIFERYCPVILHEVKSVRLWPLMCENICFLTALSTKWLSELGALTNMVGLNLHPLLAFFHGLKGYLNFLFCDSLPTLIHFKIWITGFIFSSSIYRSFFFFCNMSYRYFCISLFVF